MGGTWDPMNLASSPISQLIELVMKHYFIAIEITSTATLPDFLSLVDWMPPGDKSGRGL